MFSILLKGMIDYESFFNYLQSTPLTNLGNEFAVQTDAALKDLSHGDFQKWRAAIEAMPQIKGSRVDLTQDAVTVEGQMNDMQRAVLKEKLIELHPWRKGPFNLFGIHIDAEWRSDLKWARLADHVALNDKLVLDIGCGNGYYLFRMLGAGAKAAIGADPFLLYVMQFHAVNKYIQTNKAAVLPLGVDDVPAGCGCFDSVFSMGILYHRREPKEHLQQLHGFLKPDGQIVLETIVLDSDKEELLVPKGRYGKMRNVWVIASPTLLTKWLNECGFDNIEILDITLTTSNEQRRTEWMTFESLDDFLDPDDNGKTIEGHPAPGRAILLAQKI